MRSHLIGGHVPMMMIGGSTKAAYEVVTHVLGTFCYLCLQAGQAKCWSGRMESNPRMQPGKLNF
jgi:hypothetical protein